MTLVPTTAAAAVYHDALSTARGFRTLCFLVLLLCLLGQIGTFFAAKYWEDFPGREAGDAAVTTSVESTEDLADGDDGDVLTGGLYMLAYATLWLGLVFGILLSLTLCFTTLVMLCGRTVGVDRVAKAFLWSLVLLLLLVPWQSVLTHPSVSGGPFHIPGVLWTWPELMRNVPDFAGQQWLGWVRFVGWPVVALILLAVVYAASGGGIKRALGEDLAGDDLDDRPVS